MAETNLKLLDCNRKGILGLPSGAVHLWLCYYMHESEQQESYLSVRSLARITGMDTKTVMKWQRYLLENGWLVQVGATAADRYSKPSRGANKVPVVRVDDPLKCGGVGISPTRPEMSENLLHPKLPTKVYGSSSGSGCRSNCVPLTSTDTGEFASLPTLPSVEKKPENQKPKAKPIVPVPVPKPPASATRKKVRAAKDGTPWPDDFNSWTNVARTEWLDKHSRPKEPTFVPVTSKHEPMQKSPEITPSPPSPAPAKTEPSEPEASKPSEPDWRQEHVKRIAGDVYALQLAFNTGSEPPKDWETAWLPDSDALVALGEGKGSMGYWMLDDVIALSQVRYAAKYTSPAAISADVVALGREVADLRIEGTFAEVRDAYGEVVCPPEQQSAEDELDDEPAMWIDPEVKAERKRKELAKLIMRWNSWLNANAPQEENSMN